MCFCSAQSLGYSRYKKLGKLENHEYLQADSDKTTSINCNVLGVQTCMLDFVRSAIENEIEGRQTRQAVKTELWD